MAHLEESFHSGASGAVWHSAHPDDAHRNNKINSHQQINVVKQNEGGNTEQRNQHLISVAFKQEADGVLWNDVLLFFIRWYLW